MFLSISQSWMPCARRANLNKSSNRQIMALWVSDKSRRQGSVCLTKKQESSCAGSTETQTLRALFLNVERKTKHAGEKVVGSLAIKTGGYVARCPKRFIHDIETHASLRLGCYLFLFAFPLFSRNWLSLFGEINRKKSALQASGETLKMHRWKCRTRTPSLNPYIGCLHRSDILNPFIQSPLNSLFEPCFNQISNSLTALLHWIWGARGKLYSSFSFEKRIISIFLFNPQKSRVYPPPLLQQQAGRRRLLNKAMCVGHLLTSFQVGVGPEIILMKSVYVFRARWSFTEVLSLGCLCVYPPEFPIRW